MIFGTGIDIVEIQRLRRSIERYQQHFLNKVYTAEEQAIAQARGNGSFLFYAGRWAAKEAVSKAIGTGFGAECSWTDICVLNDEKGRPVAEIGGGTAETLKRLGIRTMHVSISHDGDYATAIAIAET